MLHAKDREIESDIQGIKKNSMHTVTTLVLLLKVFKNSDINPTVSIIYMYQYTCIWWWWGGGEGEGWHVVLEKEHLQLLHY